MGLKAFECLTCGKKFVTSEHLRGHIRSHTGEKPFKCKICGKSFSLRGNVSTHMKLHLGYKPHQCLPCNKSFTQKTTLLNHMKSRRHKQNTLTFDFTTVQMPPTTDCIKLEECEVKPSFSIGDGNEGPVKDSECSWIKNEGYDCEIKEEINSNFDCKEECMDLSQA